MQPGTRALSQCRDFGSRKAQDGQAGTFPSPLGRDIEVRRGKKAASKNRRPSDEAFLLATSGYVFSPKLCLCSPHLIVEPDDGVAPVLNFINSADEDTSYQAIHVFGAELCFRR